MYKQRTGFEWKSYLYVAPAFICALVFSVYPILYLVYLSLYKVDVINDKYDFIGFGNYVKLIHSEDFHQVFGNTLIYMACTVSLTLLFSLLLALVLSRPTRLNQFVQGAVFSPHVISLTSLSLLWMWLMNKDVGLLNQLLSIFGLPKLRWLESSDTALMSVILVSVWKGLGYNILMLIAGLQSIPASVIEAAKLDRASKWNLFVNIQLPLLSPTLFFMLVVNIIASFQVFDSISVMTGGGPVNSTNVLAYWIYQTSFQFSRLGEASAGALILFVLVSLLTIVNFRVLRSRIHYQ
jgi:sn-glycerol 3-phosphate transport system permease protein